MAGCRVLALTDPLCTLRLVFWSCLAVSGDQITFSPSSSTSEEVNCAGTKKQKPGSTLPNTFTYRIGPSSDGSGGVALYLTSSSGGGETEYRKE